MKLKIILLIFLFVYGNFYADSFFRFIAMAERGSATAQFNLGYMYDKGKGVTRNYKQAFNWYRKAADRSYAAANFNLGSIYLLLAFRSFYDLMVSPIKNIGR